MKTLSRNIAQHRTTSRNIAQHRATSRNVTQRRATSRNNDRIVSNWCRAMSRDRIFIVRVNTP
jgi:hypothetical protein